MTHTTENEILKGTIEQLESSLQKILLEIEAAKKSLKIELEQKEEDYEPEDWTDKIDMER